MATKVHLGFEYLSIPTYNQIIEKLGNCDNLKMFIVDSDDNKILESDIVLADFSATINKHEELSRETVYSNVFVGHKTVNLQANFVNKKLTTYLD